MVAQAAALPSALHAHQRLLAQPGGTVGCLADGETIAARGASQHAGTPNCHSGLHCSHQRATQALRVDEDRRRDSRQCRPILSSDFRLRTLAGFRKKRRWSDGKACPSSCLIKCQWIFRESTQARRGTHTRLVNDSKSFLAKDIA